MWIIGVVVLVVGLMVSVALHEYGHLYPAKKFGAAVPEYWVGFGPEIWKTKKGGTTYGVKAILLGGYVRIVGMFAPGLPGRKMTNKRGQTTLAEQARIQSAQDVQEAQRSGTPGTPFYQLSTPKKVAVMAGGPLMNLGIALVLIAVVLVGFGWQAPTTTLESVLDEVEGQPGPAALAGVRSGDQIVSWNQVPTPTWDELRETIQETPETGSEVTLLRDGKEVTVTVVPIVDSDGTRTVGIVSALGRQRGSVTEVGQVAWQQFVGTGKAIIGLPVGLYKTTRSLITGEERDPNGVVSLVGVAQIAGQITSADPFDAGAGGTASPVSVLDRVAMMLSLLAALNMALFVFNLIPLPPLDGGHVVGALYGGGKNVAAKVRGKPKPPPADTARMMPLTYIVFGTLIALTVLLMLVDVVNPIAIT